MNGRTKMKEKVLEILKQKKKVTAQGCAKALGLGVEVSSANELLKELQEEGQVTKRGKYYFLKTK